MDYYDFPLTKTMREAFAFGGDLRRLKDPEAHDEALGGPKAITFVRNHDIDRGQNDDRGLVSDREKFGIGWTESSEGGVLDRTDVELAYAFYLRSRRRSSLRLRRHEHYRYPGRSI
jgi:hypothetical protein